ncbi:MAG: type II toxin-antitoxin system RelE/ParE family toxin [Deltaproteobacteria bacterium]|nr:type II toxin-antitoxin system RelE/ParE family toxin [Deltaproteobacteria bacterium]
MLPFAAEAADELEAAAAWYESERPGYGSLFLEEVARKAKLAARFPQSGTRVSGFDVGHDVRSFRIRRFPYSLVTAVVGGQATVFAVAHHSREPGYWCSRLR